MTDLRGEPAFESELLARIRKYYFEHDYVCTHTWMCAEYSHGVFMRLDRHRYRLSGIDEHGVNVHPVVEYSESLIRTIEANILDGTGRSSPRNKDGDGTERVVNTTMFEFPWDRTREEWQTVMDADEYADDKVAEAVELFNRSKGQFSRWDYTAAGYPKNYSFKIKADDRLCMYVGYYRMIPVNSGRFRSDDMTMFATNPACIQLESTLERWF